jgi:putative Mg2+ transporter-C (MgtC) family protein
MTLDSLYATLLSAPLMLPLLGSLVTGALIGAEREIKGKPAGLRTHTLVCFGSALMMLIAARQSQWDTSFLTETQLVSDLTRMPHAILTGIGFLGAGVIFREGLAVQGLTTAASLWLTASLGIVYGAGMLELALIGTLIVLAVLVSLRLLQAAMPVRGMLRVSVRALPGYRSTDLLQALASHGLEGGHIAFSQTPKEITLSTTVPAPQGGEGLDALCASVRGHPMVRELTLDPVE